MWLTKKIDGMVDCGANLEVVLVKKRLALQAMFGSNLDWSVAKQLALPKVRCYNEAAYFTGDR